MFVCRPIYGYGFLNRSFTDRREILHGGSAASRTSFLLFLGIASGMVDFWASIGHQMAGYSSRWSTYLFICLFIYYAFYSHLQPLCVSAVFCVFCVSKLRLLSYFKPLVCVLTTVYCVYKLYLFSSVKLVNCCIYVCYVQIISSFTHLTPLLNTLVYCWWNCSCWWHCRDYREHLTVLHCSVVWSSKNCCLYHRLHWQRQDAVF